MTRHLAVSACLAFSTFACTTYEPAISSDERASLKQDATSVSNILVFGDYDAAISRLTTSLRQAGHSVTAMETLPPTIAELRSYNTIWHAGVSRHLHPYEQDLLIEYVNSGGGLHLGGERTPSDDMNDSLGVVVNALVAGGGIQVGRFGSDVGPARGTLLVGYYSINLNVLDGALFDPAHFPADIQMAGVGRLGGVSPRNVMLTGASNLPVGAIWDSGDLVGGAGTLSIVMDSDWLRFTYSGNPLFLEKLVGFRKGAPNHPPVADAGGGLIVDCVPAGSTIRVILDGTGSYDPDGDILTFIWTMDGQTIGTGVTPLIDLGPGVHTITLTVSDGRLQDSDTAIFQVIECDDSGDDGDNDGIPDEDDACPGTSEGEIVDDSGCSIVDLCPCDADWTNHGAYTSCIAHATNYFVAAGLITGKEKGVIVSTAARSDCGKGR